MQQAVQTIQTGRDTYYHTTQKSARTLLYAPLKPPQVVMLVEGDYIRVNTYDNMHSHDTHISFCADTRIHTYVYMYYIRAHLALRSLEAQVVVLVEGEYVFKNTYM